MDKKGRQLDFRYIGLETEEPAAFGDQVFIAYESFRIK